MTSVVYAGYFADPFVLRLNDETYCAFGGSGAPADGDWVFDSLESSDLVNWTPKGKVLQRLQESFGDEYWAPEVVEAEGHFWMYYSVGHGIAGHHIRVARAQAPLGPFVDQGVNLTPHERFAIDPHPFLDADGAWYLIFARDVLDADRPGTHLAALALSSMTIAAGDVVPLVAPNEDWQIYERQREMYGRTLDWHTLEGPTVTRRHGRYWLTFSGGAWTGDGYAVSWAHAEQILGPWSHAPVGSPPLLSTRADLIGPGHNSLAVSPDGRDVIVFHAWDEERATRRMHVLPISFEPDGPRVDGPT